MASIIRVSHRRAPYAVIDRRMLEDDQLSWAARGILGYLLAKPDDWQLRVSDLRRRGDLGRDALRRLLQHLQDHGYVKREQIRDERGRVTGTAYTVFETSLSPGPENPAPDEPGPGQPAPARAPLLSNKRTKYSKKQITTTTEVPLGTATVERAPWFRGGDEDSERSRDSSTEPVQRRQRADDRVASPLSIDFPPQLSQAEASEAGRSVCGLVPELAQQVLDELGGRLAAGAVRGSPLSYLRGLVERAKSDKFTPEVAIPYAAARERRHRTATALARAAEPPALAPADENHPLVKRALAIRSRAQPAKTKC